MSSARPRGTSSTSTWHDGDHYATMNRLPSAQAAPSQRQPLSSIANQEKPRNGFGTSVEKAVPVPGAAGYYGNGGDRNGAMAGRTPLFDIARSPPNPVNPVNKNTKHVPCKFFRQGACQAGNACPFSHSIDPMAQQTPCKYFMKGNCKFGAKCALAHYLPDGRRVNRAELDAGLAMGSRPFNYSRSDGPMFPNPDAGMNDTMLAQAPYSSEYFPNQGFPLIDTDEQDAFENRYGQYQSATAPDSGLNSPPTSQFGSPPNDFYMTRPKGDGVRTALNAPLPQSFDADGISSYAKYGPLGQSVPDTFGMRSPGSSSLSRQLGSPPESVFSARNAGLGSNLRNASPLGASPQNGEESIGQRIMHSQKVSKPRMISSSMPRTNLHEWEEGFAPETDLLPNSLHDEVLTPQEKMRRMSRPEQDLASRDPSNALNIPSGTSSKVGSPPTAGSPSRFSALWAEQREKKATEISGPTAMGQVGSPLRESWMPHEPADLSRGQQISGISQAMARMQLTRSESNESNGSNARPPGLRHSSAPTSRFDRTISSPGLVSKKIDEEGEGVFFPMDDNERVNSHWSGQSPRIAPLPEKSNGERSRVKTEEGRFGFGGARPVFGFKS